MRCGSQTRISSLNNLAVPFIAHKPPVSLHCSMKVDYTEQDTGYVHPEPLEPQSSVIRAHFCAADPVPTVGLMTRTNGIIGIYDDISLGH